MSETAISRRFVTALLAGLGLAPKAFAQPRPSGEDELLVAQLREGAQSTIETADDPYKRMTAPVMINGQGPFHFVVDTGANQSVLSAEIAAALALPPAATIRLNGVAGMEMTQTVTAARLDIGEGGAIDPNVSFAVLPQAAIGAEGILGVDRFRNRRITLDFRERRLLIDPPYQASTPFSVRVPAVKRSGQLMIVNADLSGIKLSAFLDSGAERTIGNPALYQLATIRRPTTKFYETPVVSVTGATLPGQAALLPALRLGGVNLTNVVVTFADLHVFKIWRLVKPSLLIGVDLLSVFDAVTLDFRRSEVIFQMRPDQMEFQRITLKPANASRIPRSR